jgi:hypothetical protein
METPTGRHGPGSRSRVNPAGRLRPTHCTTATSTSSSTRTTRSTSCTRRTNTPSRTTAVRSDTRRMRISICGTPRSPRSFSPLSTLARATHRTSRSRARGPATFFTWSAVAGRPARASWGRGTKGAISPTTWTIGKEFRSSRERTPVVSPVSSPWTLPIRFTSSLTRSSAKSRVPCVGSYTTRECPRGRGRRAHLSHVSEHQRHGVGSHHGDGPRAPQQRQMADDGGAR